MFMFMLFFFFASEAQPFSTMAGMPETSPLSSRLKFYCVYHYTQNDYRTELYHFRIFFGNFCSVITEPICLWN